MATYRRAVRVAAPFDEVWAFHSRISGLEALTPGWMGLEVAAVHGPDGTPDPEVLETGSEIEMALRPLTVGPPQRWTARITGRDRDEGSGWFRDEMVDGPFDRWVHTHRFFADGDATIVDDRVEYALPGGPLGRLADPFAVVGFEPMFRFRHRKTRQLLESGGAGPASDGSDAGFVDVPIGGRGDEGSTGESGADGESGAGADGGIDADVGDGPGAEERDA